MSLYEDTTNERLAGQTIVKASVSGHGITLVFDNGVRFEYDASDGGYSCWAFHDGDKEGGAKSANDEIKLKPCPFCGGDAVMLVNMFGGWTVCCTDCDCRCWDYGPNGYETKGKAAEAWNRRADS